VSAQVAARGGFPFTAVVGMDELRLALVLNAVSPAVGGVLVRGEKGTAKSTMVRALAAVLPDVDVVAGCRFSCDPAVLVSNFEEDLLKNAAQKKNSWKRISTVIL